MGGSGHRNQGVAEREMCGNEEEGREMEGGVTNSGTQLKVKPSVMGMAGEGPGGMEKRLFNLN